MLRRNIVPINRFTMLEHSPGPRVSLGSGVATDEIDELGWMLHELVACRNDGRMPLTQKSRSRLRSAFGETFAHLVANCPRRS